MERTHPNLRGHYRFDRFDKSVYYASSYELRCLYLMDQDFSVTDIQRGEMFRTPEGKWRSPDLLVTRSTKFRKELIEVKPKAQILWEGVEEQIRDSKIYAQENGLDFIVWTEDHSGFTEYKQIIGWAREYLTARGETEFFDIQKANRDKRAKKHYDNVVSKRTVTVFCDHCQIDHIVLIKNYTENVKKNKNYVCEKKGGYISGSRPKPHLHKINVYASECKKLCPGPCGLIRPFEDFGKDKHKRDGLSRECKVCKKLRSNKSYRDKKMRTRDVVLKIHCSYCDIDHEIRKGSYESSLEKYGRYICYVETGHINGSLPKPHLQKENPHAHKGKKQCLGPCGLIRSIDDFGKDRNRTDALSDKCRECRSIEYYANKPNDSTPPKRRQPTPNPYASDGKKQCSSKECRKILPFEMFSKDASRPDGYNNTCIECRKRIKSKAKNS